MMVMNEREINFLRRHPTYTFLAICLWYPLDGEQLRKYRKVLYWDYICENEAIDWSTGLIRTFLPQLIGDDGKLSEILHYNNQLPWSVDFIKHFEKYWHWNLLGEIEKIRNDSIIQEAFCKYLKPVNAWLNHLHELDKNQQTANWGNKANDTLTEYTLKEIELRKNELDWSTLSAGVEFSDWNMDLLLKFENYLEDDMLSLNKAVWQNCFGNLSNREIESLLSDRKLHSLIKLKSEPKHYSEKEESHFIIPEHRTFNHFMKSSKK
jgi:hypothetical protein